MKSKVILAAILGFMSCQIQAAVDCPAAKVKNVQPDKDRVYIQLEGQAWQSLGMYGQPGTEEKMSVALTALATEKSVILRFPDGSDSTCATEVPTTATMIRISR